MKRSFLALGLCLLMLTGCSGNSTAVPQTVEEVDSFADVLAFVSGQPDVDVAEVQVQANSHAMPTEPVSVPKEEAEALLSQIESLPFRFERYDPLTTYGAVSYSMICTLETGETVTMWPDGNVLEFVREEKDDEGVWQTVCYALIPEDIADADGIYRAVRQLWTDTYSIPEGETRTAAQILGDKILDARQIILRMSLDGKSGTEIRLYVDTAAHPDLFDALTGLTLAQEDVEKGESYIEIFFHVGDEDYRFGEHILTHGIYIRGERMEIDVGADVSYRMFMSGGGSFTDWLIDWVYAHKDEDGVKIVRWDAE